MHELTVQPGDLSPGIVPNAVCHAHPIMRKACEQLRYTTMPHSNSSVSWGTQAQQTQHGPPSPCPMGLGSRDHHHSLQRHLLCAIARTRMPGRTCMLGRNGPFILIQRRNRETPPAPAACAFPLPTLAHAKWTAQAPPCLSQNTIGSTCSCDCIRQFLTGQVAFHLWRQECALRIRLAAPAGFSLSIPETLMICLRLPHAWNGTMLSPALSSIWQRSPGAHATG